MFTFFDPVLTCSYVPNLQLQYHSGWRDPQMLPLFKSGVAVTYDYCDMKFK